MVLNNEAGDMRGLGLKALSPYLSSISHDFPQSLREKPPQSDSSASLFTGLVFRDVLADLGIIMQTCLPPSTSVLGPTVRAFF